MSAAAGDGRVAVPSPRTGGDVAAPAGKDWFFVDLYEWMWRDDGLGLRPGADLMVYATIYRASAHGGGAFVATNSSMGALLGYPRETISRSIGRLLDRGLVWVVSSVRDAHGGKPVRHYAVSQAAIDTAQSGMSARQMVRRPVPIPVGDPQAAAAAAPPRTGNVTDRHVGGEGFPQGVTDRHAGGPQRDHPSRGQRDNASRVTDRHIAKNDPPPADTRVIDTPLISPYHVSTDQADKGGRITRALAPVEEDAFRSLVAESLRPVDPSFVADNRAEFERILSEGVPAEVVLAAYRDYASYQREQAKSGAFRPMHLLNWLRQRPNKNIQYLMVARSGHAAPCPQAPRRGSGRDRPAFTHDAPRLVRCLDGIVELWHVTDERGGRLVRGSEGVATIEEARALYERMYEHEAPRGD